MTKELIIVFGVDEKQKPHAAKFNASQSDLVKKAADAMGLRWAIPKGDAAEALADRLPPGKIFASGNGMVPFCPVATYQGLMSALGIQPEAKTPEPAKAPQSKAADKPVAVKPGEAWAQLKVGDKVIGMESPDQGWWPAVITECSKDGKSLTLRWLDSKQPSVNRKRTAVALLFPA